LRLGLLAALATGLAAPAAAHAGVTWQLDPGHTGATADGLVAPPLSLAWTRDFGYEVGSPLVVGDRVYVSAAPTQTYGTNVMALDAATGATVWSQPVDGPYYHSYLAYDDGRVFAVNSTGTLWAFDAADGHLDWKATDSAQQHVMSDVPVADRGLVHVAADAQKSCSCDSEPEHDVMTYRESDGALVWSAPAEIGGDGASLAVDGERVYVTDAGHNAAAFDRTTGRALWATHDHTAGGASYVAAADGTVYSFVHPWNDPIDVLDGASGTWRSTLTGTGPVAVDGTVVYLVDGGGLHAQRASDGQALWTALGGERLVAPPLAVGQVVYVASASGQLFALDRASGRELWRGPDPQKGATFEEIPPGLAAGPGLVVVPTTHGLDAWRGAPGARADQVSSSAPGTAPSAAAPAGAPSASRGLALRVPSRYRWNTARRRGIPVTVMGLVDGSRVRVGLARSTHGRALVTRTLHARGGRATTRLRIPRRTRRASRLLVRAIVPGTTRVERVTVRLVR
jgi:outer membrane protein assembly factor BamB